MSLTSLCISSDLMLIFEFLIVKTSFAIFSLVSWYLLQTVSLWFVAC